MTNENESSSENESPRFVIPTTSGKYGDLQFFQLEAGNPSDEELSWPILPIETYGSEVLAQFGEALPDEETVIVRKTGGAQPGFAWKGKPKPAPPKYSRMAKPKAPKSPANSPETEIPPPTDPLQAAG